MDNPFASNLQNVTDPSDFKSSKVPKLTELDALQRCFICKEFMKAPMTTSCNHTFCSHCIREYLVVNSSCPLCKTEQFESNLKKVILLEEIINCYVALRHDLLLVTSNENAPENEWKQEIIEVSDEEPPLKKQKNAAAIPTRDELVDCPICSKKMTAQILQSRHIDECLGYKKATPRKKNAASSSSAISSFFQQPKPIVSSVPRATKDHLNFYFNEVDKHNAAETKKLPKLDFKSLSTPRLKEKLSQIRLLTAGTRTQLELRYNQFYILFNSNLDSNHPVLEKVLHQRLNQWEGSHLAFGSSAGSDLFSSRSISFKLITDKDFLVKRWLQEYRKQFKGLIKNARMSHQQKRGISVIANGSADVVGESEEKPAETGKSHE